MVLFYYFIFFVGKHAVVGGKGMSAEEKCKEERQRSEKSVQNTYSQQDRRNRFGNYNEKHQTQSKHKQTMLRLMSFSWQEQFSIRR